MLVAPSFSYAQTAPATTSDLDTLKTQLITLLTQEVQMLQDQLTEILAQEQSTATDVATLKSNTLGSNPIGTESTGGSPDTTITPFVVYDIEYEQAQYNDVYYSGNKQIDPTSVQIIPILQDNIGNPIAGNPSNITFTSSFNRSTNSCWFKDETGVQFPEGKVCGDEVYRLVPSSQIPSGGYYVKFTSTDGQTYTTKTGISIP